MPENIFPSIPYFRGEDNKYKQYSGAPVSLYDSMLLNPNQPVELAYNPVKEMAMACTTIKEYAVGAKTAANLVNHPLELGKVYEYWAYIAVGEKGNVEKVNKEDKDEATSINRLVDIVDNKIFKAALESKKELTQSDYFQLISEACHSPYRKQIEQMMAGFLSRESDPTKTIEVLYNLAADGLKSGDEDIIGYLLEIFNYNTNILRPDSALTKRYSFSLFSEDDHTLSKFMELDAFSDILSPLLRPDLIDVKNKANNKMVPRLVSAEVKANPNFLKNRRVNQILQYYKNLPDKGFAAVSENLASKFPYNLALNSGPVRDLSYRKYMEITKKTGQDTKKMLFLPGESGILYDSPPGINQHNSFQHLVKNALDVTSQSDKVLSPDEQRTIIDYLCPELSLTDLNEIRKLTSEYKKLITLDPTRSIGVNGTEIIITDQSLRSLGYQSIIFEYAESKPEMKVIIKIGKEHYQLQFLLDQRKNLLDLSTREPLNRGQINADYASAKWFEVMVLSHLFEYSCSQESTLISLPNPSSADANSNIDPNDSEKFTTRVGHLRLLNPSERFSQTQFELALLEQGWNLAEINENRKQMGLSPKTYVRILNRLPVGQSKKPDRFRAHTAMNSVNQIISR